MEKNDVPILKFTILLTKPNLNHKQKPILIYKTNPTLKKEEKKL